MGFLDSVNDVLQPGGIESVARRAANGLLGNFGATPVSQNLQDIYGYFLGTLLQSANSIPVKPLWICFLDNLPDNSSTARAFDQNRDAGKHDLSLYHSAARSNIDMRGATAALLVQEINMPGDSYNMNRGSVAMGGYLNGAIGQNRTELERAKIAFIETNYSFTDFVLRPWMIDASYNSLKYCDKTNITMINFAKAGSKSQFVPRTIITLNNCVPINIDSETYQYAGDNMMIRQVQWHYDTYTIKSGQLIQERDLLNTLDRVLNIGQGIEEGTIRESIESAAGGLFSNVVTNLAGKLGDRLEEEVNDLLGRDDNDGDRIGIGGSLADPNGNDIVNGVTNANQGINNNDTVISSQLNTINRSVPVDDTPDSNPVEDQVLINPNDTPVNTINTIDIEEVIPPLSDIVENQVRVAKKGAGTSEENPPNPSADTPSSSNITIDEVLPPKQDSIQPSVQASTTRDDVIINSEDIPKTIPPTLDDQQQNQGTVEKNETLNQIVGNQVNIASRREDSTRDTIPTLNETVIKQVGAATSKERDLLDTNTTSSKTTNDTRNVANPTIPDDVIIDSADHK